MTRSHINPELTYDLRLLSDSLSAWQRSAGLRAVYAKLYQAIRSRCVEGRSLELGAGIGVSKLFFDDVVTSDVAQTPYVDCAMSAYAIASSEGGAWANIFAIDMLHHLMRPMDFFASAARAAAGRAHSAAGAGGDLRWQGLLCALSS